MICRTILPIIISHGVPKSASSFLWQNAKEAINLHNKTLPKIKLNHPDYLNKINQEDIDSILEKIKDKNFCSIIKYHNKPFEGMKKYIDQNKILAFTSTRDPRDIALAFIDAGKKERKLKNYRHFYKFETLDQTVKNIKNNYKHLKFWLELDILCIPFSLISINRYKSVNILLKYLNFSFYGDIVFKKFSEKNNNSILEFNKGINKRYVNEISKTDLDFLNSVFEEEIALYKKVEKNFYYKNNLVSLYYSL